jgi:hypothetical protein
MEEGQAYVIGAFIDFCLYTQGMVKNIAPAKKLRR